MKKTQNLKDIQKWSEDKLFDRIRQLGDYLANNFDDMLVTPFVDELIVIYLEILGKAIKEKEWDASPLDLFIGVYRSINHPAAKYIFERFLETKSIIDRFKGADKVDRGRLRPQLVARGMI